MTEPNQRLCLVQSDLAFLRRQRKTQSVYFVIGWLCLIMFLLCSVYFGVNYPRMLSKLEALASQMTQSLQTETDQFRQLETSTSTEALLVHKLIEKNQRLNTFVKLSVWAFLAIILGGIFGAASHGVMLLHLGNTHRRYLRLINTLMGEKPFPRI